MKIEKDIRNKFEAVCKTNAQSTVDLSIGGDGQYNDSGIENQWRGFHSACITQTLVPCDYMTERKTQIVMHDKHYNKIGYLLIDKDGNACVSAQGAVRWLKKDAYRDLMHGANEFKPPEHKRNAWISVGAEMPEQRIRVWASTGDDIGGDRFFGGQSDILKDQTALWRETNTEEPVEGPITHWMDLPDAPGSVSKFEMFPVKKTQEELNLEELTERQKEMANSLDSWNENAAYLLSTYPQAVRKKYKFGAEDVMQSLIINFIDMRDRIANFKATGLAEDQVKISIEEYMAVDLKPCPHCESKNVLLAGYRQPNGYTWIACGECGSRTQEWDRMDKTIGQWNRRTRNALPVKTRPVIASDAQTAYLYRAAISCGHSIENESITLRYDHKADGHNALNQLSKRLAKAFEDISNGEPLEN